MGYLESIRAYESKHYKILKDEKWLMYLAITESTRINLERIKSLTELTNNYTLNYVKETLSILESSKEEAMIKDLVFDVLKWSEVSKAGMTHKRREWLEKGYNLDVHNIGSAQIYMEVVASGTIDPKYCQIIETLILTHGLMGQYIRGEVSFEMNLPLCELITEGYMTKEELTRVLKLLNQCIIKAVNERLWERLEVEVYEVIDHIMAWNPKLSNDYEYGLELRIGKLRRAAIKMGEDPSVTWDMTPQHVFELIFKQATLWYVEAALSEFTYEEFVKIMALAYVSILEGREEGKDYVHISFEPFMNDIYYELDGHKRINIYKKRIIEKYLKDLTLEDIFSKDFRASTLHIKSYYELGSDKSSDTLYMGFVYSSAANKLIDFCQEAEHSEMLYEKAIILLYDLFELRKDNYDRFNEEGKYLSTMNQSIDYKKILLDDIIGEKVMDIGPGGGALMDLIEERYPTKRVLGVDISTNVIETLEKRKKLENKQWDVVYANALSLSDYVKPGDVDTIIFCSILHELYSYIEFEGHKFNTSTLVAALKSAFDVLPLGGRIIIRDGIMSEPRSQNRIIRFLSSQGIEFLDNYCRDFKGREITYTKCGFNEVMLPINDAMEFLYTYTWGEKSFVHEVQEQFGYFTPSEFRSFVAENFGEALQVVKFDHFLQEGYTLALSSKIELFDESYQRVPLPDSTYIAVLEKVKEA